MCNGATSFPKGRILRVPGRQADTYHRRSSIAGTKLVRPLHGRGCPASVRPAPQHFLTTFARIHRASHSLMQIVLAHSKRASRHGRTLLETRRSLNAGAGTSSPPGPVALRRGRHALDSARSSTGPPFVDEEAVSGGRGAGHLGLWGYARQARNAIRFARITARLGAEAPAAPTRHASESTSLVQPELKHLDFKYADSTRLFWPVKLPARGIAGVTEAESRVHSRTPPIPGMDTANLLQLAGREPLRR